MKTEDDPVFGDESLGRQRRRGILLSSEEERGGADVFRLFAFFLQQAVVCGLIVLVYLAFSQEEKLGFSVTKGELGLVAVVLLPLVALSTCITYALPVLPTSKMRWWK